eukprot:ANDGO_03870.mRNA.1 hypothetical protein
MSSTPIKRVGSGKLLTEQPRGTSTLLMSLILGVIAVIMASSFTESWWRVDFQQSGVYGYYDVRLTELGICAGGATPCKTYEYGSSAIKSVVQNASSLESYMTKIRSLAVASLVLFVVSLLLNVITVAINVSKRSTWYSTFLCFPLAVISFGACILAVATTTYFSQTFVKDVFCGDVLPSTSTFGVCVGKQFTDAAAKSGYKMEWGSDAGYDRRYVSFLFGLVSSIFAILTAVLKIYSHYRAKKNLAASASKRASRTSATRASRSQIAPEKEEFTASSVMQGQDASDQTPSA